MGTLLLVGEESRTEVSGETVQAAARSRPSLKGALERIGYHVVNAKDAAGALASLSQVLPDVIVLAGTVPDMELLDLCAAVRHDPAAEKTSFVLVADAAERAGGQPRVRARILSSRGLLAHSRSSIRSGDSSSCPAIRRCNG